MFDKYNAKGKTILFLAFTALSGALILGFVLYQRHFNWPIDRISFDNMHAQKRILEFLERAGWKLRSEKVIVEKVGDDLGLARAVLLKKSNDGVSVPGVLFLVGRQYILVGRLFDSQTGRDLSPDLFGRMPIMFDVNRLNLNAAHKRGSEHPKVVIVEYGDYGCRSCAKLEKVWQPLLDNFPDVQHVYKHFPLSDGSRYLAEIAEAVSLQDEAKFWKIHQRFMSVDKSNWDENETKRFAYVQLKQIGLVVRFLGERMTYVGRTETERKPYQYRVTLRYVERTQQNPYGLVVSSVEQSETPAASSPNPQSRN